MNKQINIKESLDWYIWAGVTETCAEDVCILNTENHFSQQKIVAPTSSVSTRPTATVLKNARDICVSATSLDELREILIKFEGCNLKNTAASTVFGDGDAHAKVMLIGEAPGADEDRMGKPFVGRCGKLLDKMLEAIHLRRENCYITNVLPWRPPGNRTPTDDEVAVCLPFLKKQIDLIKPDFILLLGGIALKAVMDNSDSISRTRGKWLEYVADGKTIPVLATYHPSYLLRSSAQKAKSWADFLRLKKKMDEIK